MASTIYKNSVKMKLAEAIVKCYTDNESEYKDDAVKQSEWKMQITRLLKSMQVYDYIYPQKEF